MILAIFACVDLFVSGGITSQVVVDGKPQMFRYRTVSNVTSKVLESGGVPDGGNSKSHWELLITRRGVDLGFWRDVLFAASTLGRLPGGWMVSNVFLKASVPLSTKSLLSLVKFAFSRRSTEAMALDEVTVTRIDMVLLEEEVLSVRWVGFL